MIILKFKVIILEKYIQLQYFYKEMIIFINSEKIVSKTQYSEWMLKGMRN